VSKASLDFDQMIPRQIVAELDTYIIGQDKAKRAVAIALRNRVRRKKLPEELQDEVAPKNIIMIGPTGVGKTEIARRISKLSGAPFIKVEATKFTEVGYVGRDVESMIRDLMHVGINMVRQEMQEEVKAQAEKQVEELLLDLLVPGSRPGKPGDSGKNPVQTVVNPMFGGSLGPGGPNVLGINIAQLQNSLMDQLQGKNPDTLGFKTEEDAKKETSPEIAAKEEAEKQKQAEEDARLLEKTRQKMRVKLEQGELEDREVEVLVSSQGNQPIEIFSGNSLEEFDFNLGNLGGLLGGKKKKKHLPIKRAREVLLQEEIQKLLDQDKVNEIARERVQNMGIVFIDEIDKIASRGSKGSGPDISREGVQRDILPIVEGCQVNTKYGLIDTSHILFIAAGAFHMSKPSDLIPELQGRFPIRVELESLGEEDFLRILTQPANAITRQYEELLKTEGVQLVFSREALEIIAHIAADVNHRTENIGARRLSTIMERLLEEVSFHAPDMSGQTLEISPDYVKQRLDEVVQDQDLSRYIL